MEERRGRRASVWGGEEGREEGGGLKLDAEGEEGESERGKGADV